MNDCIASKDKLKINNWGKFADLSVDNSVDKWYIPVDNFVKMVDKVRKFGG